MSTYLQELGVDPTVIEFILQQEPNSAQLLTNEVRKNPVLTVEQLGGILFPQKSNIDPYLPSEKRLAKNWEVALPQFSQWVLVNLRKLRKGVLPSSSTYPNRLENIDEVFNIIGDEQKNKYYNFREKIPVLVDWVGHYHPDLSSFSAEQAFAASDEWHKRSSQEGAEKFYETTQSKNIIYGPEWKNKELQGWTIQKVFGENDLKVEGNRMNHCIGDYCEDVERGDSIVYSLRDPQNNPHVTIETNGFNEVMQIQGNSNSIPKKEYREMIREWIGSQNNPGISQYNNDEDPFNEINNYSTGEDVLEIIEKIINDDYGLKRDVSTDAVDIMTLSISMMEEMREPSFWGDWNSVPAASIDMMIKLYGENDELLNNKIKELETEASNQENEVWEWATMNWEYNLQNEDYETPEALEEAESELMSEELKKTPQGGYAFAIFEHLNELREKGILPPHQVQIPDTTSSGQSWYKSF